MKIPTRWMLKKIQFHYKLSQPQRYTRIMYKKKFLYMYM